MTPIGIATLLICKPSQTRQRRAWRNRYPYPFLTTLFSYYALSSFLLLSLLAATITNTTTNYYVFTGVSVVAAVTASESTPYSPSREDVPTWSPQVMARPPVDFAALGPMAVLGDFDALTPMVTEGQHNTFESNTFSIVELVQVPSSTGIRGSSDRDNKLGIDKILWVPVLLASFPVDPSTPLAAGSITTSCFLNSAPHQVYIGGSFRQSSSVASSSAITSSSAPSTTTSNSYTTTSATGSPNSSLNFIGINSSRYQTLGSFGGGIAIWKSNNQRNMDLSNLSPSETTATTAHGYWVPLPFKGVDGLIMSVAKMHDGTIYFGGQFNSTADGESFRASDTQPVSLGNILVSTGNGQEPTQGKNILCNPETGARSNWMMRDNIPGYWRMNFPLLITPTLFRLWNVDTTALQDSDEDPNMNCDSAYQGYQDFVVENPVSLHAIQIDVLSWYGLGGGLGGIEVYQSEIFVYAVDGLNYSPMCSDSPGTAESFRLKTRKENATVDSSRDKTATSSFLGADWKQMNTTNGLKIVLATGVSATDMSSRQQVFVDMSPYLPESGMYDVYLFTPTCGHEDSPLSSPSNACKDRGYIDVSMYFTLPDNVITVTLSQAHQENKYEKIYSGMVVRSTPDFRPHIIVGPFVSKTGTTGRSNTQTVVVDSIQFVKQVTLSDANGLLFYRPGSDTAVKKVNKKDAASARDKVQGLDSSSWGNLPTPISSDAVVNSLVTYHGQDESSSSTSSLLFIGGAFKTGEYSNVVAWDGSSFVPLQESNKRSPSGLDGVVMGMALHQSQLYVVGQFQEPHGSESRAYPLGGLAMYDIQAKVWSPFGNATLNFEPDAQFTSIELSAGSDSQPQLVIRGIFTWLQNSQSVTNDTIAIWDINSQEWIKDRIPSTMLNEVSQKPNQGQFPFGYIQGELSYVKRVLGSSANCTANMPIILVAGAINSLDTYKVYQPKNMAWLTSYGVPKTVNLLPAVPMDTDSVPPLAPLGLTGSDTSNNTIEASPQPLSQAPMLSKTSTGIMYYNKSSQHWVTIVGGTRGDGIIGTGYFYTPTAAFSAQDSSLKYKDLKQVSVQDPSIVGEVMALGLRKDAETGCSDIDSGHDLLLIGGAFKTTGGSSAVNALVIFDLAANQVIPASIVPTLRGDQDRDPVMQVIKNRPGDSKGTLVLAGNFTGVGAEVICELICIWDPAAAREALDKGSSLEASFESVYGDNGGNKHSGALKDIVNDIAFEDDNNMLVAGDLNVNGVHCGVASFNLDTGKWTTFGLMVDTTDEQAHSPSSDTLTGPVTAIAHDSMLHQFFIAGRSLSDGSGYFKKWNGNRFILVSSDFLSTSDIHGIEILPATSDAPLRTSTPPISGSSEDDLINYSGTHLTTIHSVISEPNMTSSATTTTFFDGKSWFPYLQSSRDGPVPSGKTLISQEGVQPPSLLDKGLFESVTLSETDPMTTSTSMRSCRRDQGVFRALAIAHLPRIIAREYLALKWVVLISVTISMALIFLIVLFGFFYVWIMRRVSRHERAIQPQWSAFKDDGGYHGSLERDSGGHHSPGPMGLVGSNPSTSRSFFFRKSKAKKAPESTSGILSSLGIAGTALEADSTGRNRQASTIKQTTDAVVAEFVRSHEQQQQQQQQQPGRGLTVSIQQLRQQVRNPNAPQSSGRRNKKTRQSVPQGEGRDSSSSDLMNPLFIQGRRFSTLLTAGHDPTSPISPVTTVTTPGGVLGGTSPVLSPGFVPAQQSGSATATAEGVFYYAQNQFRARKIGELGFQAGERILVVDMSDDVWWMGVTQDVSGQQMHGVFPSSYVGLAPLV
ncbi:MAG: cortical protein marker for cell polarity-domain-containing protein [Benniella sp.]|nr:MAG: cortical protein marker for cell polarity-domain-containing protein [Benniella sp.]